MTNEEFQALKSGDIIQHSQTRECFVYIDDAKGNHKFLAPLRAFFDPRPFNPPTANIFHAVLPAHDVRPFTAPDNTPPTEAVSGSGDIGLADRKREADQNTISEYVDTKMAEGVKEFVKQVDAAMAANPKEWTAVGSADGPPPPLSGTPGPDLRDSEIQQPAHIENSPVPVKE